MDDNTNTLLIQKLYAAFNSGDMNTVLASVSPDAEWIDFGPSAVPYFGDFTGRMQEFFKAIAESNSGGSVSISRYIAAGDAVVAEGRYRTTVRSTGATIDEPIVHIFTIRDGKITSWRGHGDTAAVLAAHTTKAVTA